MPDFKLPDLGEGVTEAEIDRWLVKEGQEVNEDDPLVEVITDKATAEIPSPYSGKVARLHVKEGDIVPVGTVLVTIGDGEPAGALEGTVEALFQPHEESVPPREGEVAQPEAEVAQEVAEPPDEVAAEPATPEPAAEAPTSVKATPPVRKLARDLGVDLATIQGSGPGGRILREDVEASVAAPEPAAEPAAARVLSGTRMPFRGVRRMIAEQMVRAHGAIPPVTHVEECDVTELDAARRLANERSTDGTKLTFLPFIVKAVVAALKDHPALNSTLDEDAGEIV